MEPVIDMMNNTQTYLNSHQSQPLNVLDSDGLHMQNKHRNGGHSQNVMNQGTKGKYSSLYWPLLDLTEPKR